MHWRVEKGLVNEDGGDSVKMGNMVFEMNKKALCISCPIIYNAIIQMNENLTGNAAIVEAKNGEPIIIYRKADKEYYLNSRYNPASEAKKFMEGYFAAPDEAVITMFGLANVLFLRELLINNRKKIKCIVYEPSVEVFIEVLKNIDITDVFEDERVRFIIDGINEWQLANMLNEVIDVHNKCTNCHITLPKYKELFPEAYAAMDKFIREQYIRLDIETITTSKYAIRVCKNNLHNMCYLIGARNAIDYIGIFPADMPAVLVGAGPSLSKNISLLKKVKGKAFIAVADTAVRHVCEAGVVPDAIFSIDFIKPVSLFEAENINKIPFVASMDLNYEVLDKVKPENLIFNSFDPITWKLLEDAGSKASDIDTGGSVANAIISTLIVWGFKRIIMIGQDLAMTDNKRHVGEEAVNIDKDNGNCIEVESFDGGKVVTRHDLYLYINWISDICRAFPDVLIIDATEGGAKKENTKIMPFQAAIDEYCQQEYDITSLTQKPPRLFVGKNSGIIVDAFHTMKSNLENLKVLMEKGVTDCKKGAEMLEQKNFNKIELEKINSFMAELDEELFTMEESVLIAKYVVDIEYTLVDDLYVEEADNITEAIRMYKKSGKYYQAIVNAIPPLLDIIDKCMDRLSVSQKGE